MKHQLYKNVNNACSYFRLSLSKSSFQNSCLCMLLLSFVFCVSSLFFLFVFVSDFWQSYPLTFFCFLCFLFVFSLCFCFCLLARSLKETNLFEFGFLPYPNNNVFLRVSFFGDICSKLEVSNSFSFSSLTSHQCSSSGRSELWGGLKT